MWKNLVSRGHQAPIATRHIPQTPTVSTEALRAFSTTHHHHKEQSRTQTQSSDVKDREILNPERSEVTKSGTDQEVAQHASSYDPSNVAPESELEATEKEHQQEGKQGNPLRMSPANKEASATRGATEGGADHNVDKAGPSTRGWTRKNRAVHVKEDGTHVSYR